jgi:K+-sensing histidine kinase KdpD
MFGQQQKAGSYENTGVGLGLAYCKMVVEKMNGIIKCVSQENKGTLISFFISVEASHDDHGLS